jgi:hypothetical protein
MRRALIGLEEPKLLPPPKTKAPEEPDEVPDDIIRVNFSNHVSQHRQKHEILEYSSTKKTLEKCNSPLVEHIFGVILLVPLFTVSF